MKKALTQAKKEVSKPAEDLHGEIVTALDDLWGEHDDDDVANWIGDDPRRKAIIDDFWNAGSGQEFIDTFSLRIQRLIYEVSAASAPFHVEALDVAEMDHWQTKPLHWHVDELFQRGALILIAAASQTGKTLFMLYVALRMLGREKLFGHFRVNPIKKVAYFALEDPARRIKERLKDYRGGALEPGRFCVYVAPGLKLHDDACFLWLEEVIRNHGFQVVVLDTYQKATPGLSSFEDEAQSLILHRLASLVRKYDVTLVILDHLRKADGRRQRKTVSIADIKGTGGKAQNADAVILMERDGSRLKLQAFNKDLDHSLGFLLDIAPEGSQGEKFTYAGEIDEQTKDTSRSRNTIIAAFDNDWTSSGDIAKQTKLSDSTVRRYLRGLLTDGTVEETGKGPTRKYRLSNQSQETAL